MSSNEERIPEQYKAAGRMLRELLKDRGASARFSRLLIEEGFDAGEQLPRRWSTGRGFSPRNQKMSARLLGKPETYFETAAPGPKSTSATPVRHASLANVLASRKLRQQAVDLLLAQDRLLETDDPGETHWSNMADVFEALYALHEARKGPRLRDSSSRRR